jgi:hypothetical protein
MKRILAIAMLCAASIGLHAQTGWVTVTASNLTNPGYDGSTPQKIVSGTAIFCPVNTNGARLAFRVNGNGQAMSSCVATSVTNGALSLTLADTNLTSPQNVCYSLTIKDSSSGSLYLGGYGSGYTCLQPAYSNTWCVAGSCNLDSFAPTGQPLVIQQTGPTGPQGPAGPNAVTSATTTTFNAILKGNGVNVQAAAAGTDYATPASVAAAQATANAALPANGITSTGGNLNRPGQGVYAYCTAAGMHCDGTTDDTTAFQNLLNTVAAAGGGVIQGTVGKTSLISSAAINVPNTGVADPVTGLNKQNPIVIDGLCPSSGTLNGAVNGCFALNLTFSPSSGGKINTYGEGQFTIINTVIEDTGSDCSNYFFYTTNTSLYLADDAFIGSGAGGASSCSYGALLGGTTAAIGNGANNAYQGYHTMFFHNYFSKMQHIIDSQMYANAVNVLYNTVGFDSGSSVVGDAFINITGSSAAGATTSGWNIVGNLFEETHITYAIKLNGYAPYNNITGNELWDGGASSYLVYLGATGNNAELISCAQCGGKVVDPASPGVSGATASYLPLYAGATVFGNATTAFAVANGSGATCTAITDLNLNVGSPAWTGASTVVFPTDGSHNAGVVICGSTLNGAFYIYNFATNGTPASPQTASIAGAPKISIDQFGELNATNNVLINGGSNQVLRCTTAGTLPVGALTTVAANCGASTADGLYVK